MKSVFCASICFALVFPFMLSAQSNPSLAGLWAAYRDGVKVADCEIIQNGDTLEFVIKRDPAEKSRGRFLNAATVLAADWNQQASVRQDGSRLEWGNSYWIRTGWMLAGQWAAYRDGIKVADCEIIQSGTTLEFVIKRNPAERSRGRFLDAAMVMADEWKQQAKVLQDGRRLEWGNSYWIRTIAGAQTGKESAGPTGAGGTGLTLGGQWAAFRDGVKVADCEIIQSGATLEFVIKRNPAERSRGRIISANTVIADDWKQQATIRQDGRHLDWGNSYWIRADK